MSNSIVTCFCLLLSFSATMVRADSFLQSRPALREMDPNNVKQILFAGIYGHVAEAKLIQIESELRPLFMSLPKTERGWLEPAMVRYALHRYFVQKQGWYIKGLDATWSHDEAAASTLLKARASAYIQSLFEEQLHGRGFGLRELAVFAATVSELIHTESVGQLETIHAAKNLSVIGPIPRADADAALEAFLVAYLLFGDEVAQNEEELQKMKTRLTSQYPEFSQTELWMRDLQQTHDLAVLPARNPFVEHDVTFDDSAAFVVEFSHRFGAFQNLECHSLKGKLIDMEHSGTGRVRMADFYANALSGGWEFMESTEYLRNQGVLDESEPDRPQMVIPNYINSLANCLTASNFYAMCCVNECEQLMGHLEQAFASPRVAADRIVDVVSHLQSDTVDAPRKLSAALLGRLAQISEHHGGLVPLHGRLFAQWMHHAYPRECPYPHISGTVKPLSPLEFAMERGVEALQATHDEMKLHHAWVNETSALKALPWTQVEEELAIDKQSSPWSFRSLQPVFAVMTLISFGIPLARAVKATVAGSSESQVEKHLV